MNRFQVKVCGLTRPIDARRCARLGADMVGMIFYRRSPRLVTLRQAAMICDELPPTVDRVGLFVDEKVEKILSVAERLRLDYVQLHGDEPARQVKLLQASGIKVIKAFGIATDSDWKAVRASKADLVLADNNGPELRGGTGKRFDWQFCPKQMVSNLVLAGGLNADNLEDGLHLFKPLVVDVNSGVESRPGIKSEMKLKQFFRLCDRLRNG